MERAHRLSTIERQEQILHLIAQNQRVSVDEICAHFSVSLATARRDLEALVDQSKVQRIHGGAIALPTPPEPPVLQRTNEQASEKQRIGRAAAKLIGDGETVFLGSGTTVLEVARNLRDRRNLTVITNSLLVINTLDDVPDITIVCLGGMLRHSEQSLIGHIAEQSLKEVRADKVIMGIRALDLEYGLTNDYLPETMADRAILKIGREVVIVADHTKCQRVSTAFVAPITVMHILVTDTAAPPDFISALTNQGIRVFAV